MLSFIYNLALSKQSQEDHEFKASNWKFQPFGWECRRRNPTRWSQVSTHAVAHRLSLSFVAITSVQDTHLVKRKGWCEFSFSSFHLQLDLCWGRNRTVHLLARKSKRERGRPSPFFRTSLKWPPELPLRSTSHSSTASQCYCPGSIAFGMQILGDMYGSSYNTFLNWVVSHFPPACVWEKETHIRSLKAAHQFHSVLKT